MDGARRGHGRGHYNMNKGTQIMSEQEREIKKSQLAVAIAQGGSAGESARAQSVPKSTAYKWAKEREVRREVEACRRRSIDQAVDMLAKLTPWAAVQIAELAATAENEVVRLKSAQGDLFRHDGRLKVHGTRRTSRTTRRHALRTARELRLPSVRCDPARRNPRFGLRCDRTRGEAERHWTVRRRFCCCPSRA